MTITAWFANRAYCRIPVDRPGIVAVKIHASGRYPERRRVFVCDNRPRDRHQTGPVLPGKHRTDVAKR